MNDIRRIMNGDYWTRRRVGRLNQLFLSAIRGFRGFDLLRAALGVVAANGASFHAHDGATLPHASESVRPTPRAALPPRLGIENSI